MLPVRLNRRTIILIAASLTTLLLYLYTHSTLPTKLETSFRPKTTLPCAHLPGADDTVVILKTGSTELQSKLSIHLRTTLNCYPHHLTFSDHADEYENEKILDALEPVSEIFKTSHQDFALYRQLQKSGSKPPNPLPNDKNNNDATKDPPSILGHPSNPAWVLDKYKFLPMLATTLQTYPSKSWYIFLELDSFIFWSTLLLSLAPLNPQEKHYIGAPTEIDDTIFAHGGSGFALSRAALEAAVELYEEGKEEWEAATASHWAGDAVLGKLLLGSGTDLTWAWPIWQGGDVGNMSYGGVEFGKRLWCYPTVSYHHVKADAIEGLWEFEQGWIAREGNGRVLRHRDVFREFVIPRTGEGRGDWDNHADGDRGVVATLGECRGVCEKEAECLQYALDRKRRCLVTGRPNLGEAAIGVQSGWIQERMQRFYDTAAPCEDEEWIL